MQSISSPYFVVVVDFDNDNILDIIVANYGTNTVDILRGYGDGSFTSPIVFPLKYGSHPFAVVVGDFNSDKKLDFAVANEGTDNLNIFVQTCFV